MRTGRAVSRVAASTGSSVVAAPARDTAVTAAALALTALAFALVADVTHQPGPGHEGHRAVDGGREER